jgi:hypothetical protein
VWGGDQEEGPRERIRNAMSPADADRLEADHSWLLDP